MVLKNDYNHVEDLDKFVKKVIEDMTLNKDERDHLRKLLDESFHGDAGSENGRLQARVQTQLTEYNDALTALQGAILHVGGVHGQFRITDTGQSMRFANI
ncbi:hypothetical protein [Nocardia beijingensis]|uniref:WXG100 family type VII secretion target n=1 Tax=Nocardia beijingensis TaxID=95162 RepID=A0ABW7WL04_9NOCA